MWDVNRRVYTERAWPQHLLWGLIQTRRILESYVTHGDNELISTKDLPDRFGPLIGAGIVLFYVREVCRFLLDWSHMLIHRVIR